MPLTQSSSTPPSLPGHAAPTWRARRTLIAAITIGVLIGASACGQTESPDGATVAGTRTVTDMAGRQVELPEKVTSVVTLGSVPVINSFLFALGQGGLIVDGLPANFTKDTRWKYQYVFGPQIQGQPVMQTTDYGPMSEQIVAAKPDVVLTMAPGDVDKLDKIGVKAVVLRWQNDEDVKRVVTLLGNALGVPERARDYVSTFDAVVKEVGDAVKDVPEEQKVTALSLDPKGMGQPHTIAQWWIAKAGGTSVTDGNTVESLKFDAEQVVTWNPQIIFVNDPKSVQTTLGDVKLASVRAVKDKRVYHMPIAAHIWGNRTSEQPLSVAFAASKMYPDQMTAAHLKQITQRFYTDAFHHELTDAQVDEILAGM